MRVYLAPCGARTASRRFGSPTGDPSGFMSSPLAGRGLPPYTLLDDRRTGDVLWEHRADRLAGVQEDFGDAVWYAGQ
jgi:hypothetical protein